MASTVVARRVVERGGPDVTNAEDGEGEAEPVEGSSPCRFGGATNCPRRPAQRPCRAEVKLPRAPRTRARARENGNGTRPRRGHFPRACPADKVRVGWPARLLHFAHSTSARLIRNRSLTSSDDSC